MTPLSLFDLDRTITRRGTWTPWLIFWARREAPWRLTLLPLAGAAGLLYAARLISRTRLKEIGQALLMGGSVPRARVDAAAAAYAGHVLATNVHSAAIERIAVERAAGRRIVIATASCQFYVAAVAARLDIANVIATRSVWDGDRLRARIAGENCYGAGKLRMVEAWLAANDLNGAAFRFFSDHISDLPMFEAAAERIATTPSAALRRVAALRGWSIVDWR